jgi:hypothetical protein
MVLIILIISGGNTYEISVVISDHVIDIGTIEMLLMKMEIFCLGEN